MKKLLLVSTAIAGIALMSSPASAALKMDLGGFYRGYAVWTDNNEAAGNANSLQAFTFRRDSEVHVNGETTLDNGLTVGAHTEMKMGGSTTGGASMVDEEYAYFSGGWGRFNFGEEDGAAYLLQVAAPSADSNVDGMRVYVQALNPPANTALPATYVMQYQHADFRSTDRLTYLTPKFNGFQAGVSYAPSPNINQNAPGSSLAGQAKNKNVAGTINQDAWEGSVRWDGEFSGVGINLGGGYSSAGAGLKTAVLTAVGSDELKTWNVGANFSMSGFSLGGAYKRTNNGISQNGDTKTWDVGLGWDNGPYHVGGSYYEDKLDTNVTGVATKVDRWAAGVGYTFGPGLTFRGSVDWGTYAPTALAHTNFTQGTVGTDIQF